MARSRYSHYSHYSQHLSRPSLADSLRTARLRAYGQKVVCKFCTSYVVVGPPGGGWGVGWGAALAAGACGLALPYPGRVYTRTE